MLVDNVIQISHILTTIFVFSSNFWEDMLKSTNIIVVAPMSSFISVKFYIFEFLL